MNNNDERIFSLGQVLNITTGKLFTNMEDIYDTMSYIVGDNLSTIGLLENRELVSNYILSKYPNLKGVGVGVTFNGAEEVTEYLERQEEIFGNDYPLSPMKSIGINESRTR